MSDAAKKSKKELSLEDQKKMLELQKVFDEEFQEDLEKQIQWFEDRYYYACLNSANYVVGKQRKGEELDMIKLSVAREVFSTKTAERKTVVSPNVAMEPVTEPCPAFSAWEKQAKRYRTPVFSPSKKPGSAEVDDFWHEWNHWSGVSSLVPVEGNKHAMFLEHVYNNVCHANQQAYNWLLDWIADMFQNPARQQDKIPIFRGDQGSGRSTVQELLTDILGTLSVLPSTDGFFGHFNACLEGRLLVTLDEQSWSGDRQNWNVIKKMTGSRTFAVERKGKDQYQSERFFRVMCLTNDKWSAPVETGNRRIVIFDVYSEHTQDRTYFGKMRAEWDGGGKENFLYEMLHRQIKENWSVCPVFAAAAHSVAVLSTLQQHSPETLFLIEDYRNGRALLKMTNDSNRINRTQIWKLYQTWATASNIYKKISANDFYTTLETIFEHTKYCGIFQFTIDYTKLIERYPFLEDEDKISDQSEKEMSPSEEYEFKEKYLKLMNGEPEMSEQDTEFFEKWERYRKANNLTSHGPELMKWIRRELAAQK